MVFIRDEANAENTNAVPVNAYVAVRLLMDGVPVYSHDVLNEAIDAGEFKTSGMTDFLVLTAAGATHTFQMQYQCNYPLGLNGTVFAKAMIFMISR
jgi:hypothetical protein